MQKGGIVTTTRTASALKWLLLASVTVGVTWPLTLIGVPSAALFAALLVGIALALCSLAPTKVPRTAGLAAQGVLGVYIGTMVHSDALSALGSDWPVVAAIVVATLVISVGFGVVLSLHREISPLTGALSLVAGGASGLVAIARELGGDDRVVAVVQYLRVGLVTATMPLVVTFLFQPDTSHPVALVQETATAPWYLSLLITIAVMVVGITVGKVIHLPGAGMLGPLAITVVLEVTGLSYGLSVPVVLVQLGYLLVGWQAGVAITREALKAIGKALPLALTLIVVLGAATAGLGLVLSYFTGLTPLEGYLATSPGGIYAVLATAAETGSNVTFIIAAQVLRVLVMLFLAPLMARGIAALTVRFGQRGKRAITEAKREPIAVAD